MLIFLSFDFFGGLICPVVDDLDPLASFLDVVGVDSTELRPDRHPMGA